MVARRAIMYWSRLALVTLLLAGLAGCATTIGDITLRPEQYYQQKLTVRGRITRRQDVGNETVLEIADARERRILVTSRTPVDQARGDWVAVTGVLVPEARIGGQSLFDVIAAEAIEPARPPLLPNLF